MSAKGRWRSVSHFTAESHPPSRLLFMCSANVNPTGNRRPSEAMCKPEGTEQPFEGGNQRHWKSSCFKSR